MNIRFHGVPQRHLLWAALCMAASWGPASAQTAVAPAAAAAPASTPPPAFRSALEGYKPYADEPIADWKQANDEVARVGGWRAYAREVQDAAPPAKPALPKAAQPLPAAGPAKP